MFKGSFIKLILGAIILLFSYVFPVFLIPIGSYSYSDSTGKTAYSFALNGEMEANVEVLGTSSKTSFYYTIDDGEIYVGIEEDTPKSQMLKSGKVKNIYTIEIAGKKHTNNWALGFTIIGFVLTGWGLIGLFVPKKKR